MAIVASGTIEYPISMGWIERWKRWDVVRELTLNAMDASEDWTMQLKNGIFYVEDKGEGMSVEHLVLGQGREITAKTRARFHEGFKKAMLVITRHGTTATTLSRNLKVWNSKIVKDFDGTPVEIMALHWQRYDEEQFPGTQVRVPWATEEIHEDRFLRPGDARVVFTDDYGRSILQQDAPDIFVRDVWTQKADGYGKPYAYGYNLVDARVHDDRDLVATYDINAEIARIWAKVDDPELLDGFITAIANGHGEIYSHRFTPHRKAFKAAWDRHYDAYTVIETTTDSRREAEHRGATVVKIGTALDEALADVVGSDVEYVQEMEGAQKVPVPDKKLDGEPLKNLRLMRRLAKRVSSGGSILAYLLGAGHPAEIQGDNIRVDVSTLKSDVASVSSLIEELAHKFHGTKDGTPEHTAAIKKVAAELILSYARRK